MYSEFWLIRTNYGAQLGSKAKKRQQICSTYDCPKKLKSIQKFYKFLFLSFFLITIAFTKSFLYLSYYQLNEFLILTIFVNIAQLLLLMLLG